MKVLVRTESIKSWLGRKAYHRGNRRAILASFGNNAVPEIKTRLKHEPLHSTVSQSSNSFSGRQDAPSRLLSTHWSLTM